MVDIDIAYQGELRCHAVHRPSRTEVSTDAPLDNRGRAETFSPTDLLATALGTCMLTLMGIRARDRNWDLEGTKIHVKKFMTTTPPRRVARLEAQLWIPNGNLEAEARETLENAAHTCPVRLSLAESIEVPVVFDWGTSRP
jgi:putative redox protein